ncbi:MAG: chemotaxis-specific protein-glutamate methyltransferase CheB [Deltaproteobacteria bacterium]|nr:chemotaxis-specific protein-glutamate methyltransferase CheB [Deltaproteobacteria bacterium]
MNPIRVLIVDDSATNRRTIQEILQSAPEVEVVGKASDGEEALRSALTLKPDLVTLDLQMPRMDGFTFLRILMSRLPLPVIVVSTYSGKENVFKALELGALDFIAKPGKDDDPVAHREEILAKVGMVRHLSARAIRGHEPPITGSVTLPTTTRTQPGTPAKTLVAIGASTGGPAAIGELVEKLPADLDAAVVVAQHMPEKFTRTFAERLDRRSACAVREATDGELLAKGVVLVAPGRRCLEVAQDGEARRVRVVAPAPGDRYVPSVDRLFTTAAGVFGPDLVAVVLTGMGDDGKDGVQEVAARGGRVMAEAPETAVIFGMPGAAVRTGCVHKVVPLGRIAETLLKMVKEQSS